MTKGVVLSYLFVIFFIKLWLDSKKFESITVHLILNQNGAYAILNKSQNISQHPLSHCFSTTFAKRQKNYCLLILIYTIMKKIRRFKGVELKEKMAGRDKKTKISHFLPDRNLIAPKNLLCQLYQWRQSKKSALAQSINTVLHGGGCNSLEITVKDLFTQPLDITNPIVKCKIRSSGGAFLLHICSVTVWFPPALT